MQQCCTLGQITIHVIFMLITGRASLTRHHTRHSQHHGILFLGEEYDEGGTLFLHLFMQVLGSPFFCLQFLL